MHYDNKKFLEYYENDSELIVEILKTLIDSHHSFLENIEKAIREKKPRDLELHAHTMKGIFANFFAEELKQMAHKLEEDARNSSFDNAQNLFSQISIGLKELVKELSIIYQEHLEKMS